MFCSGPPSLQFLLPTSAVSVDIGSNESLSCGFLGYPPPNVTWIFNQRVISADRQVVDGTVTYLRVDRSILQSGEYVCVGENYLGRANYTFQVVVNSTYVHDVCGTLFNTHLTYYSSS